ncbi:MAG TPA: ASCH domain-containing protein [Candidatus Binatia bacterium]|nr:ASCH domain-containing protein [Candidatus Binatia bacterium]
MIVKLFKPEFAEAIASGRKTSTIRPFPRGRLPRIGELISLRVWTGRPYRSKQREIGRGVISQVEWVSVGRWRIMRADFDFHAHHVNHLWLSVEQTEEYARQDGFNCYESLKAWFDAQHGLPFSGIRIAWTTSSALPEN